MRHLPLTIAAVLAGSACLGLAFLPAPAPSTADRLRQVRAGLASAERDPGTRLPPRAVSYGDRGLPPPTETWLIEDDERSLKSQRKEWIGRMHRAAPGIDTKAMDREVGRRQVARRTDARRALQRGERLPVEIEGSWVERGSENQAGRMHAAAHSSDGRTLVAGSSQGGVWRVALDGSSAWEPIGDSVYGGAHWLALVPAADGGEEDVVITATDWGYVNRTADGGLTWEEADLAAQASSVRRLLVTTEGSDTVFLVTGNNSGAHTLQRSTDGGASFEAVLALGSFGGDLWASRTGDGTLYLADRGELLVSTDLGDSWVSRGSYPEGNAAWLAGSEAGAPTLYLVLDGATLYRSDDAGGSFDEVGRTDDFWGVLTASTVDPMLVAWGGFELWRSYDGGASSSRINEWFEYYGREHDRLHADMMGFDVVAHGDGSETWYLATDGGLYASTDGLGSVQNLSLDGLRVSQYYDVLTDVTDPERFVAGSQDQGYQLTMGEAREGRYDFDQLISGDYGQLVSGDGSLDFVFSVYPGFILGQVGADGEQLEYIEYPQGESGRYFAWLPPLAADPTDPASFFFCGTRLWRYTFDGDSWEPEQWSDEAFDGRSYEFLSAITFAPSDPQRAYAATSWGALYTSDDGGVTWEQSDDSGPDSHYFYGTAIVVDPDDPDVAWAGGSGYGEPAVYRTTDGGESWEPWGDGLPDTLVYGLALASDGSGRLFAAAQTAAYVKDGDEDWVDITGLDAPITTYWSVEALADQPTMRFGTYGRGIWDYQYTARVPEPTDTGGDGDSDDDGGDKAGGCGCGGGAPAGLLLALLPALLVRRRR